MDGDPEGRVGQLASPGEVAQHVIPAAIDVRDLALAGHMPGHVLRQHRCDLRLLAPRVEEILLIVEVTDELCVWMLAEHRLRVAGGTGQPRAGR